MHLPGANHSLHAGAVASESRHFQQMADEFLAAVLESHVCEAIFFGYRVVRHAAESQYHGAQHARPILSCRAVDKDRSGRFFRGEVGEDSLEGGPRVIWRRAGAENGPICIYEPLFVFFVSPWLETALVTR
jgi:hypothetical protein